jgi:hypothetical protein
VSTAHIHPQPSWNNINENDYHLRGGGGGKLTSRGNGERHIHLLQQFSKSLFRELCSYFKLFYIFFIKRAQKGTVDDIILVRGIKTPLGSLGK